MAAPGTPWSPAEPSSGQELARSGEICHLRQFPAGRLWISEVGCSRKVSLLRLTQVRPYPKNRCNRFVEQSKQSPTSKHHAQFLSVHVRATSLFLFSDWCKFFKYIQKSMFQNPDNIPVGLLIWSRCFLLFAHLLIRSFTIHSFIHHSFIHL